MSLSILTWVCALFMIGRNIPSLFFKIRDLLTKAKRQQWIQTSSKVFKVIMLIGTAILGLICGIALLFPNIVFGYYMFIVVSGMMIYSYFTYVGSCYEEKKWGMFSVSILVIVFTSVLVRYKLSISDRYF